MEEKILGALAEMDQKFEKKFAEMDQKFEKKFAEMEQKFDEKLTQMDQKFEKKFAETNQKLDGVQKEMDNLREQVNQNMNDLGQKILDRQFVFEYDYGSKIDAIFDYVQFHQKNNLQRFDRINNLEQRIEKTDVQIFNHEKRISALERKKV